MDVQNLVKMANRIARHMVKEFGMSRLGKIFFGELRRRW